MCKVSRSRKCRRLRTAVNRKSCATRWIGQEVVRISLSRVSARGVAYVKASEGVEKSCPRKGRRKRGLRKGKRRARRQTSPHNLFLPAPDSKGEGLRVFLHRERMFTAMRRAQEKIFWLVRRSSANCTRGLTDGGRRSCRNVWTRVSSRYPPPYRRLFFASSFKVFYDTLSASLAEPAPPPLPRRRGPRPPRNGESNYRPAWPVDSRVLSPNVIQDQKDGLGPEPCAWCRKDGWSEESEWHFGCLRIQRCIRNPRLAEREASGAGKPKVKIPRPNNSVRAGSCATCKRRISSLNRGARCGTCIREGIRVSRR